MWNKAFEHLLNSIFHHGDFAVTFADGRKIRVGDQSGTPVHLIFHDPDLPRRIVQNADMAVGEGYMSGRLEIEDDDLDGFFATAFANLWSGHMPWWMAAQSRLRSMTAWARQINPITRAHQNVAHHYDLSDTLYGLFLDQDWQYSCAYFQKPDDTLETAQRQKKEHIARKLLLEPDMNVLDIGCGWGGTALTLAREFGVKVTGITLSKQQLHSARARAKAEGLSDRLQFEMLDYRKIDTVYDRILSVGMFEHVGTPHYRTYFRCLRKMLAPDGVGLIHTIGRSSPPGHTSPWLDKYIFPGGYVPAMSEMVRAVEHEDLKITDLEIWRLHYAETLRHWYERLINNEEQVIQLYDETFVRMWKYYLKACEHAFRNGVQVVFQTQIARQHGPVPITRDYLYPGAPAES